MILFAFYEYDYDFVLFVDGVLQVNCCLVFCGSSKLIQNRSSEKSTKTRQQSSQEYMSIVF